MMMPVNGRVGVIMIPNVLIREYEEDKEYQDNTIVIEHDKDTEFISIVLKCKPTQEEIMSDKINRMLGN
jgi:hypothetical protein